MAKVETSVKIARPPEDVWKVIGDAGAIADWLPAIARSSYEDGERKCDLEGGGQLVERIISSDDEARTVTYEIVESPFPMESHRATMSVVPEDGASKVVWVTEVSPDEIGEGMRPIFEEGLASLKEQLEG